MLAFRPLISKGDILRAYNPNKPDSEAVFRRLRQEGVVSEGVAIRPRRGGRQRGTVAAFYALNEDAVVAYRHGDVELARKLAQVAATVERGRAARKLAEVAAVEEGRVADLEGLYAYMESPDRREPLDVLAERATKDRRRFDKRLGALGARATLARLVALRDEHAELKDPDGLRFVMPRTPELIDLAENAPVSLRTDLMNGVLMTFVHKAYDLPRLDEGGDPFADLRPQLPADLDALLDGAPLRPVAVTGPGLRWA
ncbi:MAG TPA: hypothetical protein VI318_09080 [Baekduia sp.]